MGVTGFYFCLVLRYNIMGSHTPSSENLSRYLEGGCCSERSSLLWLKMVPT